MAAGAVSEEKANPLMKWTGNQTTTNIYLHWHSFENLCYRSSVSTCAQESIMGFCHTIVVAWFQLNPSLIFKPSKTLSRP